MTLLKNHKILILLDQGLFSGTSFLITVLLARILDMESFGAYSGFVLVIYLVVSGTGAFIIQPFQVLLGKVKDPQQYATFAFWFQVFVIGLVVLFGIGLHTIFTTYFPATLLCFAAGFLLHDFGRRVLLALNRPLQTLILDAASSSVYMIVIYTYVTMDVNNMGLLYAYLSLSYSISLILLIIFLKPFYLQKKNVLNHLSNHFREGKWLFFTAVAQWWSGNLFIVASGVYLGAAALGALRLAQSLMGVLNVLLQTFENYILPQTAIKINRMPSEGLSYVTDISRKVGLLFLPLLVIIFLFAEQIFVIAGGQDYATFAFLLQGMAVLYLLIFLNQPIRLLIRATLLNQHFFYGYLINLAFALLCTHGLLSVFGLQGAIMGLAASQLLLIAYWTFILQKSNIYLWRSFISF